MLEQAGGGPVVRVCLISRIPQSSVLTLLGGGPVARAQSTRGECVGFGVLAQAGGGPAALVCFDTHECGG
jgi:hypothetical protein